MITHTLRAKDISIEWAFEKDSYTPTKIQSQRCHYWANIKNTVTHTLRVEGRVSIEWVVKNTITYILRVEDISIGWTIKKHDHAHPKSQRRQCWRSSWKICLRTRYESKMSILSESKSTITHRLGAKDVSIEWTIEKHDYIQAVSRGCQYWVNS